MTKPDDLMAAIVDGLTGSPYKRHDRNLIVQSQVRDLECVIAGEPSWGRQAENLDYAKRVRSLAQKLQRTLEGAPVGTRRVLLAFGANSSRPQMPDPVEVAASDTPKRFGKLLLTTLQDLQNGCAVLLDPKNKNKIGDYHTLDRTKHFCAATGYELMIGLEAGQPTNGDPYRFITNSLFEIVAPKEAREWRKRHKERADLRSQCEKVLSHWRDDPAKQRHTEWLRRSFAEMITQKSKSSM
jgi:hypothetical protein